MRVTISIFGSLGDVHPYLALGLELKRRGHEVVIATDTYHQQIIQNEELRFFPVRPFVNEIGLPPDAMKRIMDARQGGEYVIRQIFMKYVRQTYEDVVRILPETDVLVTHPIAYGSVIAARKHKVRWVSTVLAPLNFLSAHDPPALPGGAWIRPLLRKLGPRFAGWFWSYIKRSADSWCQEARSLERDLGLEPAPNPIFEGQFSPDLTLALFSPLLAEVQKDFPPNTKITGFCIYDGHGTNYQLDASLQKFLDSGAPPVVFTLGSAAIGDSGSFYVESAKAAEMLGMRAVLLTGKLPAGAPPQLLPSNLSPDIHMVQYAPHGLVFPRAAAVVHQGGAGTTAQAMRAGHPELVMPYSHDQYDNAERVKELGAARVIARKDYRAGVVAAELRRLLSDPYKEEAARIGAKISQENGTARAADELERIGAK